MKPSSSVDNVMLSMTRLKRWRLTRSAGVNSYCSFCTLASSASSYSYNYLASYYEMCYSKSSLALKVSRLTSVGISCVDLFSLMKSLMSVSELMNKVCSYTAFACDVILAPRELKCFIMRSKLYFIKLMRASSSC